MLKPLCCPPNLDVRNAALLCDAMGEHGAPVTEEVQDAVVDAHVAHAKLVDPVPQKVRLRAAEFVSHLLEPFDSDYAFVLHL